MTTVSPEVIEELIDASIAFRHARTLADEIKRAGQEISSDLLALYASTSHRLISASIKAEAARDFNFNQPAQG